MPPSKPRAPRKDAERNRQRIRTAAREIVGELGVAATMEDVAARAGVGIGTLYRFVGTKDALFAMVLREQADHMAEAAERALALPAGEPALRTWILEAGRWGVANRAFINVLAARDPAEPTPELLSQRLGTLLGALVDRAKGDGELRPDVAPSDVLMVLIAAARVAEGAAASAPDYADRFLALQFDALAPGRGPLPGDPLTDRQLEVTLDALAHSRRVDRA
ncbi:TetR/AcrR family transcriptional regulator [Patulibacter sp. S7RM1-6]